MRNKLGLSPRVPRDLHVYEKCNLNMVMDTVLLQERNVGIAGLGVGEEHLLTLLTQTIQMIGR